MLPACSREPVDGPRTLRLGHYGSASDTVTKAALHFKDLVEKNSDGALRVSVHPGGELGDDAARLQSTRLGALDLTVAGNPYFTSFLPVMNLLDLPYLLEGPEHVARVLDGAVGSGLLERLSPHRLVGLAYWEVGFRHLTNSVRPVNAPADLRTLKIRTTPNESHVKAFELLGASPAQMPFPELYLALQTRAVDGQENPINQIFSMRFFEVQSFMSLTRHAYTAAPIVASASRFSTLSSEHQELLFEAARNTSNFQRDLNARMDAESLERIGEAGILINESPEIQAFRELVVGATRADFAAVHGSKLLDEIDSVR